MTPYAPYLGSVAVRRRFAMAAPKLGATEDLGLGVVVPAVVEVASIVASTYHGYKRNNSVGWAIWWGLMGALFPVITPVIAVAQGFGKRAR